MTDLEPRGSDRRNVMSEVHAFDCCGIRGDRDNSKCDDHPSTQSRSDQAADEDSNGYLNPEARQQIAKPCPPRDKRQQGHSHQHNR